MEALNAMLLSDKRKAINLLSTLVKNDSEHVSAYLQLGNLLRDDDTDRAIKIHQMLTVRQGLDKETKIEIFKSLALDYKKIMIYQNRKSKLRRFLNLIKLIYGRMNFYYLWLRKLRIGIMLKKKQEI